jgi:hypothetical protein
LFQKKVPALAKAFNVDRMKPILQEVLLGPANGRYSLLECTPGKALYLPDHIINMQYKLMILDNTNHQKIATMVNARLFQDETECKTFLNDTLMPIAARMENRPEIKPFARPVAMIEHLKMTLSAFPIDGLIPTLADTTDPNKIASILADTLPEALSGSSSSRRCGCSQLTMVVINDVFCAIPLKACKRKHKPRKILPFTEK